MRWVISRKVVDGNNITKARLCARGFEELQDFPTDSPCCSQIGVRSVFALTASQNWNISLIDVKTAFLQERKIERIVYLHPPKRANTSKIWKLQKCVYGLADASKYWYLCVREELLKLGAKIISIDPGLSYWRENNTLIGILACHIERMIWGDNQYFKISIITKLKDIFNFGPGEMEAFTYIGIGLK